jgi:hypothetical protein
MKLKWCKLKKLVQTKMLNGILSFFASKQFDFVESWSISIACSMNYFSIGSWDQYRSMNRLFLFSKSMSRAIRKCFQNLNWSLGGSWFKELQRFWMFIQINRTAHIGHLCKKIGLISKNVFFLLCPFILITLHSNLSFYFCFYNYT